MPVKKAAKKTVKKVVKKAAVKKTVVKKTAVKVKTKTVKPVAKARTEDVHHSLSLTVYDLRGQAAGRVSLPEEIFGAKINKQLIAQAARVYLANQRRGTLKTKSRGEVAISTRKIYRQKGTGRARHGAASAPIFVGGGIAFGPKQRDFSLKLSQEMKRKALFSALSSKLNSGEIKVVTNLEKIEPKTKKMAAVIKHLELNGKNQQLLLVTPSFAKASDGKPKAEGNFQNVTKAARNIEGVTIVPANLINTYQVLVNNKILFMRDSLDSLKEVFLK